MSKDSSAGGGASIGFQELLRMNPELLEQMLQGSMPAAAQPGQPGQEQQQAEPAVIRTTTPDAIQSFYGSGDRIVQPDQSYYQDFALPGVQMEMPDPGAEVSTEAVMAAMPAAQAASSNGAVAGGLLGFGAQPTEDEMRFANSMNILDAADGRYAPFMNFSGGIR